MAKKKMGGLGKGLDLLFADLPETSSDDAAASTLPLREIEPDPAQPRKQFDDDALNQLADSITENGLLQARGAYSSEVQRIQLAVGLPPAHFGAQVERFTQYFRQRGVIEFEMQGKPYSIYIEDAACFPQAYAAAATMLHTLVEEPKAVILDIGGFTADYLLMKNGEIDLTSCDSLENGVILLYNKVRSKVNSELDLLLDEGDVDAILMGKKTKYPDAAIRLTEQMAQEFISDLFSTLRERMLDLQYCKVVFVGGGAILLKRQIETSGKVGTPFFVPKINANADGYEYLYRIETAGR